MSNRYGLATAVAAVLIVTVIVAADFALLPPVSAYVPAGDKALHFLLIGGLALLANLALRGRRVSLGLRRPMLGSVVVGLLISAEELSQIWLPSRTFSWMDIAMNTLGVIAAHYLADRLIRRGRALLRREAVAIRKPAD